METIRLNREIGGVSIVVDGNPPLSIPFGFKVIFPIWQGVNVVTDYWQETILLAAQIYINDILYVADPGDSNITTSAELAAHLRDHVFALGTGVSSGGGTGGTGGTGGGTIDVSTEVLQVIDNALKQNTIVLAAPAPPSYELTSGSVLEHVWFRDSSNITVFMGTSPGGKDLLDDTPLINGNLLVTLNLPIYSNTTVYFGGITSSTGLTIYKR